MAERARDEREGGRLGAHPIKINGRRKIKMFDEREEWREARDGLISEVTRLGFDEALGKEIAKNLGSPKAMDRMAAYLRYARPAYLQMLRDILPSSDHVVDGARDLEEIVAEILEIISKL